MYEVSERPVIHSLSCIRSMWDHPRNITDEQTKECAVASGVTGIAGVGIQCLSFGSRLLQAAAPLSAGERGDGVPPLGECAPHPTVQA
jgi:microsomal dipeptidase-like Zn-dependent dipeptidase